MSTIRVIRWPSLARLGAAGVVALLLVLSLPRLLRAPEPPSVPADVGLPRASALTVAPAHPEPSRPARREPREPKHEAEEKRRAPKPPSKPQAAPKHRPPNQTVSAPETATAVAYSPPPAPAPAAAPAPPPSPSPSPASGGSPPPEFGFEH